MARIILAQPGQPKTQESTLDFFMNAHKFTSSLMGRQSAGSAVALGGFVQIPVSRKPACCFYLIFW
jgi:hypothetical protein